MDLESDVQIGDFRIERRIGAGGMGIVYLARQLSLGRRVALKVLGPALNDEPNIARFQREAQAIAKLNHPGICEVYFVGQDRELCYIAMEYIDRASLRESIKRLAALTQSDQSADSIFLARTPVGGAAPVIRFDQETAAYESQPVGGGRTEADSLTHEAMHLLATPGYLRRCCEIIRDAALALAHAHERGVVHRDIKPENLLLDRQGKVHVIDFGLARFFEDVTLTNTGALVGTPMYMSPEQVTGRLVVDHRTDLYSLGMVLYELLTLRRPIIAPTREGILRQIVTKAMPPLSWINRAVPRDLESSVHKAVSKDPDERYQSAAALSDDLTNYLEGRPVAAMPYKYRLDDREIAIERPRGIYVATFVLAVIPFILISPSFASETVKSLASVFRIPSVNTILPSSYLLIPALLTGACMFRLGLGLRDGWRWALNLAIIISSLLVLILTTIIFEQMSRGRLLEVIAFLVLLLLLTFVVLPILLSRPTRDWFRRAAELRKGHLRHGPPG
jgi:serine/threonine protein kinase